MSSDIAIKVENLSKCYQIYDTPRDRLKQFVYPKIKQALAPIARFLGKNSPLSARLLPRNHYKEFWALKDVSFEVKKGETVGIIGRNGSGKSTLLQMICGTLTPTSGTVQTKGRIAALLELGSGFNPEFTGRENVYMNASILGLTEEEIDARFDDIAAFADIGEFIEQPVKTYSSGMLVRLAFAVAINVQPEILVVDEALSVGDELFQRKCFSRIETIRANGATILFVSHSGGQIVELCDSAVLMDSGEKLAVGIPKQIVARYQKLIYAPLDKQISIRNDIIKIGRLQPAEDASTELRNNESKHAEKSRCFEDFLDPNLKPSSTVDYEVFGATISSPKIFNLSGREVNCLVIGDKYYYVYTVVFERDFYDVRFGMMIKLANGTEIGGIGTASFGKGIKHVCAGTTIEVKFGFNCILLPGLYFANAGCVGSINGTNAYLHRIVDALVFKVLPSDFEGERGGYVNIASSDSIFVNHV